MDIDSPGGSKLDASASQENGLRLFPVSIHTSSQGLPYAPEDWPNPGDTWGWKTGKRIGLSGYFLDRYLYLPKRLFETGQPRGFASKLSVKQYIMVKFPDADVDAFFASFSWKIPSEAITKDSKVVKETMRSPGKTAKDQGSEGYIEGVQCKAGNRSCSSLCAGGDSISKVMSCDLCCSEPGFCRDCCCILCCRRIDKVLDNHSYIRCDANIKGYTCAHLSHIDCALRAYMAGTVGGFINLDTEYYCRRCDSRTDLISHVRRLLEKCESSDSPDHIEKILKVCICILHGSKKVTAKELLLHIELAMSKLKNGVSVGDIWKREDVSMETAETIGVPSNANDGMGLLQKIEESTVCEMSSPKPLASNFDYRVESLKLEDKVDRILDALRKSQEVEYRLAEETLTAQKNYLLNLYKQLDQERAEISNYPASFEDQDSLLEGVLNRVESIKREVSKLKDMAEVAKGFGRVPKCILKDQFGLEIED